MNFPWRKDNDIHYRLLKKSGFFFSFTWIYTVLHWQIHFPLRSLKKEGNSTSWNRQYPLNGNISHVHLHVLTLAVYKTATITSTWINKSFRLVCMMTRYSFIRLSTLKHVNRWNCMIVLSLPLIWERFPLQWYKYTGGLKFVKWGQFRKMSHKLGLSPPIGKAKTR